MRTAFLAITFLAIAGPAAAGDRHAVPVAEPAGKAVDCIPIRSIRRSLVRSDRIVDFDLGARRYYRVTLRSACPRLGFEQSFTYATTLGQLCSTDIITVLEQSTLARGASCGLAPFQPVMLAAR